MRRLSPALFLVAALTAPAAAATPVFDLVSNRPLAHVDRGGGLAIDAGAAGFARYVHFGRPATWRLGAELDGKRVALASTRAVLAVPLTARQAKAETLTVELSSPVAQTVRAQVGQKTGPAVPLVAGWQTVNVPLPGGALVAGENRVVLQFAQSGKIAGQKASAAVAWVQLGGAASSAAPRPFDDGKLRIGAGEALAWYVQVPAGGALLVEGEAGGCALAARLDQSEKGTVERAVEPGKPLDLASLGGQVVRLELGASGSGCKEARLGKARLTTSAALPDKASYPKRPKNVLIWLTDSSRADRYRVINPRTRVETPVMDAFAKRATVFRQAYVQGNESRVSHASLFTGLYPAQHKFIPSKAKLQPELVILGKAVRPLVKRTGGIMGNGFISKFWGFAEGFDVFKNHIHEGGGLSAADLVKSARVNFLEANVAQPFFLYVGTIDAHVSWRAHQPWIGRYDPEPYSGPYIKALLDPVLDKIIAAGVDKISERDRRRIIALYDSDVSYNDQQFGELLKLLEQKGVLDDTLIVLTADHGEEMFEHGRLGHGQSLHEELVHVPLVVSYPPLFPPGKAVDEGAEVIDVLPTLVDALGGKVPEAVQGESLVGLAQGVGAGYPRPSIASQYELAHTMRLGRWKLWVGGSGAVQLVDAERDPGAKQDLAERRAIERRFVTDPLSLWMAYQGQWKKRRWGVASNLAPAFAADLESPRSLSP
jgi:arylsulfatase